MKTEPRYVELHDKSNNVLSKEIRFDTNSIASFERKTGKSFMGMLAQMSSSFEEGGEQKMLQILSIDTIRCAVWAGLLWRPNIKRHLDVDQVGSLMSIHMSDMIKYATTVMYAMFDAMGINSETTAEMEEAIDENFTSADHSAKTQAIQANTEE